MSSYHERVSSLHSLCSIYFPNRDNCSLVSLGERGANLLSEVPLLSAITVFDLHVLDS